MDEKEREEREEAKNSLERIQKFDTSKLDRSAELGTKFSFTETIEPAKRIITLFERLPSRMLDEFPKDHVNIIKSQADSFFNSMNKIVNFDNAQNDAANQRITVINEINAFYDQLFNKIFQYISYSVSRTVDFNSLESEGRAAVQSVEDKTNKVMQKLDEHEKQAQATLEQVRQAAAEQGVSQQAHHFKTESATHEAKAKDWLKWTMYAAIAVVVYGVVTLFLHKIPWIAPVNTYDSIQLIASKVIIFAVLVYILTLSAKNFLSHKHNAVINKHRQNSLMTFTSLVNAAGSEDTRDIILNHAASSIFSPQDTGYTKNSANSSDISSKTIIETLPKTSMKIDGN